jgi:NAD(P)-dependent dehydrogenase (short-subunit alcohol dehydrogenase family)
MLSVVSCFVYPFNATYCASKHAALALTEGVRMQLRSQGTQVVAVFAGFIDTDMATGFDRERTQPRQVAERTLAVSAKVWTKCVRTTGLRQSGRRREPIPQGSMPKCSGSGTSGHSGKLSYRGLAAPRAGLPRLGKPESHQPWAESEWARHKP